MSHRRWRGLSTKPGRNQFRDGRGRADVVGYWVVEVLEGEFAVSNEVDDFEWLELGRAASLLDTSAWPRRAELASG